MSPAAALSEMPFAEHLGIEVERASDGEAVARLPLGPEHSSNPGTGVAHGGVTFALADTAGGAAVMSETGGVTPTVDMRIDYLTPATADLRAEATVVRHGGSIGVADVVVVEAGSETTVATATGTYKTDGDADGETAWTDGSEQFTDIQH